ncbi:hypothetical protein Pelo_181 [Pelomyxa schiedti]|nr:hypothetical protein Pelo_181 [Pelomyxa schiedti]
MSGKSDEQQTKDEKTTGPEQLQQQPARPIIDDTCLASEAICGKRSAAEFISPEKPTDEEVRSASISQEARTIQKLVPYSHSLHMTLG